jgi:Tol biopolymer transport system component
MRSRARIATCALVLAALVVPASAHAAYPGANGKIAFSRDGQIWTMNADGTGETQLTSALSPSTEPEWSPDGTRIAYTRGTGQSREVRVMNANGTGDARVTAPWTYSPSWEPDGRRIAFVAPSFDDEGCFCLFYNVYHAKLDGSDRRFVAFGQQSSEGGDFGPVNDLEWSPKGNEITFTNGTTGFMTILAAPVNGGFPALVDGDECCYDAFGAAWSPDAAKLAFMRDPFAVPELWTRNRDGTGLTHLSGFQPRQVEWSPDGAKLVVFENGDLYSANPDGTGKTPLTGGTASEQDADWQPIVGAAGPGYPRPKGASPSRVSLVPAYVQCTSANRVHGPPLAFGSCSPPTLRSANVTVGTPDSNGAAANMTGFVKLTTLGGNPSPADDAELRITASVTDVRCQRPEVPPCSSVGNTHPTPDYLGVLTARLSLRLTDRFNLPSPGGRDAGTMTDTTFDVPMQCTPTTSDPLIGSTCAVATTANALNPGVVREGRRSVWQLEDVVVFDGGLGVSGPTPFLRQGIFVP